MAIKQEAEKYMEELVKQLSVQAPAAGGNGSGISVVDGPSASLKEKLKATTKAMSQGLVERDTEVRRPATHNCAPAGAA